MFDLLFRLIILIFVTGKQTSGQAGATLQGGWKMKKPMAVSFPY
jgi:hypothetical protein